MVIKVYISGISGSKEVKKRQQRVLLILDSKNVKYEVTDIAEPGAEEAKDFMQNNSTSLGSTLGDPNPRHPLPPQIFNDEEYCGDYDQFDMANEIDEMEKFLKLESPSEDLTSNAEIKLNNGDVGTEEIKPTEKSNDENEIKENEVPNEQDKTESEEKSVEDETKGNDESADAPDSSESQKEPETEGAGDKEDEDEKADEA